jgi:hypothetical protein
MDYVVEAEKKTPVSYDADVVVLGGGPGGTSAAIAAARNGADVLVVERSNCLGGTTTGGLMTRMDVSHAIWGKIPHEKRVVQGIYLEIIERCEKLGGFIEEYEVKKRLAGMLSGVECFDPQILKFVLQEMAEEEGIRLLYHTLAVDSVVEDRELKVVIIENKSGRQAVRGRVFIDATGDGDVAVKAGAKYEVGRESDGMLQPVTMTFRIGGVDVEEVFKTYGRKQKIYREKVPHNAHPYLKEVEEAKREGVYSFPTGRFWFHLTPVEGTVYVNTTRIHGIDPTKAEDTTRAEVEGLRQVMQLMNFVRKYMKGFENSYLVDVGSYIGVRESRRITGEYILTRDDVLNARKFPDAIAAGSARIDIHDVKGAWSELVAPPEGEYYQIPYRCILAKGLENVLAVGRCISTTHDAQGATRMVPTTIAVAQGAGTASALTLKTGTSLRDIDVFELQNILIAQGGFIGSRP